LSRRLSGRLSGRLRCGAAAMVCGWSSTSVVKSR